MATDSDDSKTSIWRLIGALITFAISIYAFEVAIQPALVSISPIFADVSGSVNRTPDTPAQVALFATVLLGLFVYIMLGILVDEGVDGFIEMMEVIYILVFLLPASIIVDNILPIFGMNRWASDSTEDSSKDDNL